MERITGMPRIHDMQTSRGKRLLLIASIGLTSASPLGILAQSPAVTGMVIRADNKPLAFAVGSVRRSVSTNGSCDPEHLYVTANGFHMANCPLIVAIFMAYAPTDGAFMGFSTDGRLVGAPDWMKSEIYDIEARVDEDEQAAWQQPAKQREMMHTMLQALLRERCKLTVHREMPEKPVYALVLAKGGPKFQEAKSLESSVILKEHPEVGEVPGGGGMFTLQAGGSVDFYATPMTTVAVVLSNKAGRVVVDRTGLTGRYDLKLEMRPPEQSAGDGPQDPGSSIFTVVQEQLGLKLESARGKVETLVIDHVERPTQNE